MEILELVQEFIKDHPELVTSQVIQTLFQDPSHFNLEADVLTIRLTNFSMQEAALQKIHSEFLGYLKRFSGNKELTIQYDKIEVDDTAEKTKEVDVRAMTDQEQFEYLLSINPVLKELSEKLNLDLKY